MTKISRSKAPRWGLLITAFIAGALLCLTAIESFRSAGELFDVAGVGQAEAFLRALRRDVGRAPARAASMKEFLEDNEDLGLRYIGLFSITGDPLAEAGEVESERIILPEDPRDRVLLRVGGRLRFIASLPSRMPRHRMGMGGHMVDDEEEEEGVMAPRRLVLEFEPLLWRQMKVRLYLTLAASLGASALLMASAVIFYRQNKRAAAAEATMEEQRRLASLGEMTAVLAHEIRNPLAALKGQAQLLEESLEGREGERARASTVVREAVRLQVLINELLDFARTNKINREAVDPVEVLREAITATAPETIDLVAAGAPESWPMDRARVGRALANLLRNAVQASPEGNRVTATVATVGSYLIYSVADHGDGVPEGDRERIFEPFHTGRVRGVGLGLAVVKKAAESHGGRVEVRDAEGGGALFVITLPREKGVA